MALLFDETIFRSVAARATPFTTPLGNRDEASTFAGKSLRNLDSNSFDDACPTRTERPALAPLAFAKPSLGRHTSVRASPPRREPVASAASVAPPVPCYVDAVTTFVARLPLPALMSKLQARLAAMECQLVVRSSSIHAHLFADGAVVPFHVNLFSLGDSEHEHVVEFQRRAGSMRVFLDLYARFVDEARGDSSGLVVRPYRRDTFPRFAGPATSLPSLGEINLSASDVTRLLRNVLSSPIKSQREAVRQLSLCSKSAANQDRLGEDPHTVSVLTTLLDARDAHLAYCAALTSRNYLRLAQNRARLSSADESFVARLVDISRDSSQPVAVRDLVRASLGELAGHDLLARADPPLGRRTPRCIQQGAPPVGVPLTVGAGIGPVRGAHGWC